MIYYNLDGHYLCGDEELLNSSIRQIFFSHSQAKCVSEKEALSNAEVLNVLFAGDHDRSKSSYVLTNPELLTGTPEGICDLRYLPFDNAPLLPPAFLSLMKERRVRAVNSADSDWLWSLTSSKSLAPALPTCKKRVHILALGDVGSTLLLGLKLLGGHVISSIGIHDLSRENMQRLEYEMNQMSYPDAPAKMPPVEIVEEENLFDCDVFVFCASKGVPAVDSGVTDVRMIQLEENKKIIKKYGALARKHDFEGIFAVMSDPVDQLCHAALWGEDEGSYDEDADPVPIHNIRPEQIQGFGLGVMHSRGTYYAKKDLRFSNYLTEGRAFGPHGKDLWLANSVENYDDSLSSELTNLAVTANLKTRELGFKPYIAPAIASGAISLILALEGEWYYASSYLGGVYMGVRCRRLPAGLEIERIPMPDALYHRLEETYEKLRSNQTG